MDEEQPSAEELLKQYQVFSDQVRINSLLFQGMNLILEKITKIEERLNADNRQTAN